MYLIVYKCKISCLKLGFNHWNANSPLVCTPVFITTIVLLNRSSSMVILFFQTERHTRSFKISFLISFIWKPLQSGSTIPFAPTSYVTTSQTKRWMAYFVEAEYFSHKQWINRIMHLQFGVSCYSSADWEMGDDNQRGQVGWSLSCHQCIFCRFGII
jgi:hypothetical protein